MVGSLPLSCPRPFKEGLTFYTPWCSGQLKEETSASVPMLGSVLPLCSTKVCRQYLLRHHTLGAMLLRYPRPKKFITGPCGSKFKPGRWAQSQALQCSGLGAPLFCGLSSVMHAPETSGLLAFKSGLYAVAGLSEGQELCSQITSKLADRLCFPLSLHRCKKSNPDSLSQ